MTTAWRVLDPIDERLLGELSLARARVRERVWMLRCEAGRGLPSCYAGGRLVPGLVMDLDATSITTHSEKENTAGNYKGGYGYHPLMAFLDNTREALAGVLRPASAGSNTAADHITVTDAALAQIPDNQRYGQPILVRADGAEASKKWLWHLRELGTQPGVDLDYSVGFTMTAAVREAIGLLPEAVWTPAWDTGGFPVDFADVAELTEILTQLAGHSCPLGMRVLVHRERPHPGVQLNLFEEANGWRYRCFVTSPRAFNRRHIRCRVANPTNSLSYDGLLLLSAYRRGKSREH